MLVSLAIRDVVLIERLDLTLGAGLNALTGETGAGKSILLDALGLALGNRSEAGLVRKQAAHASVTAEFLPHADHPAYTLLRAQDINAADSIILRRTIGQDGRSRAFINDQAASLTLVRQVAGLLVETHGQFELQGLFDRETHRAALDGFAKLHKEITTTERTWRSWQDCAQSLKNAQDLKERTQAEQSFLSDALADLEKLDPSEGEEIALEEQRQRLAHRDRILEGLTIAQNELSGAKGTETSLTAARRALDRIASHAGAPLIPAREALDRVAAELSEATSVLQNLLAGDDHNPQTLETIEDRLFALRAAARRHNVDLAALASFKDDLTRRLAALDQSGETLAALAKQEAEARARYEQAAADLSAKRVRAAEKLDKNLAQELKPLKLDKAKALTSVEILSQADWGPHGYDRVTFLIATNPGSPPGPLSKIASGGELARFMLALKVVMAASSSVPVMVFDEVDSGIGGATADAVGERLQLLGKSVQILVVTHSPQVAAKADHHWRVEKHISKGNTTTTIVQLDEATRREEIARMLSGASVTEEARAAAARLLAVA